MEPSRLLQLYLAFWLAVLGTVLGSFFNCWAERYAGGGGLPTGRSRCDSCGHPLGAADLLPVVSYLLCRGRCRYCGAAIPARCLAAELLGAVSFAALGWRFGFTWELLQWLLLAGLLLLLSLIDWTARLLPDKLLLAAIAVRVVFLFVLAQPLPETLVDMALGAFSVSLPLLVLSLAMDRILGKETLGGGDIKLLFVLGLYFQWLEMILLLLIGCVLALLWVAAAGRKQRQPEIPLGPFLAAAWLLVVLFGRSWVQWYLSLLQ